MINETDAPELKAALQAHGLETEKPSQLSDAFRLGWNTRVDLSDAQAADPEAIAAIVARVTEGK